MDELMGPANLPILFFEAVSLNDSSPDSKGEFSQSLLMTQGVKGPLHLISHPRSLAQLVLLPSGCCGHQGCGAYCCTHAMMCPVLRAGDVTAPTKEELLGHMDCSGPSDYDVSPFLQNIG